MSHPFNGDRFIELELKALVDKWIVATIVETGTFHGDSTRALASFGPNVITIEMDWERFQSGSGLDNIRNIKRLHGDSPEMLAQILELIARPLLFYLDAHWSAHSPLLDELEEIAYAQDSLGAPYPIIAIHDFFNPNHPEYCYDTWDIGEYRLELVAHGLDQIYGAGKWHHHFNDESTGDPPRGIVYIEPAS